MHAHERAADARGRASASARKKIGRIGVSRPEAVFRLTRGFVPYRTRPCRAPHALNRLLLGPPSRAMKTHRKSRAAAGRYESHCSRLRSTSFVTFVGLVWRPAPEVHTLWAKFQNLGHGALGPRGSARRTRRLQSYLAALRSPPEPQRSQPRRALGRLALSSHEKPRSHKKKALPRQG